MLGRERGRRDLLTLRHVEAASHLLGLLLSRLQLLPHFANVLSGARKHEQVGEQVFVRGFECGV